MSQHEHEPKENGEPQGEGNGAPEQQPPPVVPVIGVVLELMSDGTMRVRKAPGSTRNISTYDVGYLLARAERETLIKQVADAVTERQLELARAARDAQMQEVLRQAQARAAAAGHKG